MNEPYLVSFGLAVIFLLLALAFLVMGDKACNMVAGYNLKPPAQRALYNEKKLARDTMLLYLLCAVIFALGGFACLMWSQAGLWIALTLWLLLMLKYIIYDRSKKRFDTRYKKQ